MLVPGLDSQSGPGRHSIVQPISKPTNSQQKGKLEIVKTKIINYIQAGYAGLFLVSPEEQRVEGQLKDIAREVGFKLYAWSATTGLVDTDKGAARQANDPMEALLAIQELPEKTIIVLRDFHLFLNQAGEEGRRIFSKSLEENPSEEDPVSNRRF